MTPPTTTTTATPPAAANGPAAAAPPGDAAGSFAYQAQTPDGLRMSGTVDAHDVVEATRRLIELGLRVSEIEPVPRARPPRPRALRGSDFAAFNQHLAHLAKAGLPLEHGLRLIAADLRGGRLSRTIELVAAELERGTSLEDAFGKYERHFPPLYGRLMGAGVRSSNLPGVLLNLARHLELVQRLREALWRSLAYPLMVLVALMLVLVFLSVRVLPQFEVIFVGMEIQLPEVTRVLIAVGRAAPYVLVPLIAVILASPLVWAAVRAAGWQPAVIDWAARWVPLVGPVLRRNLAARWCDALRVGVSAGMDLPRAIDVAGDVTGSPALRRDGRLLIAAVESGQPIDAVPPCEMLPPTVPATLRFAADQHDLPTTLDALGEMYQRQSEQRTVAIPAFLTPLLVMLVAGVIAFVMLALLAPLLELIRGFGGV
jgi:type II secretory pathway component PulF